MDNNAVVLELYQLKNMLNHTFKKRIFAPSPPQKKENILKNFVAGMIGIDVNGNVGAGTSTNGASYKIPG